MGSGCGLMAARWQVFFVSFLSSLRAHQLTIVIVVAAIADDCDILCLLMWQAIFHFSGAWQGSGHGGGGGR